MTRPEPVLAAGEIQGNVLPGFDTPFQAVVLLAIDEPGPAADWLASLRVTSLADVLWTRERRGDAREDVPFPWVNVALSYAGLRKLRADAVRLTDAALKLDLHARSVLLGDPTSGDGDRRNWVVGRPGHGGDVLLILGGDARERLAEATGRLRERPPRGVRAVYVQHGGRLPPPLAGHEPFGFCDNISQPAVRGRVGSVRSPDGDHGLLTPRDPAARHPGLVWPGEFVFGLPAQDGLDRDRPGTVAEGGPPWTRDGSLLVFRRLRQDVAGFHRFLRSAAAGLAARHPALSGLTPGQLGAKLMGRWASGTPLVLAPAADRPRPGRRPVNDFAYLEADPDGLACPRAAHIRRAYPRDAAASGLTEANIETHRLLRRSFPFASGDERGLVFLAYQTSIERQFEFVSRAWLNNPHLHDTDDGHDPIAGQSFGTGGDRTRTFSIAVRGPDGAVERVPLTVPGDWVTPTGGGYFFVPSVSALAGTADGRRAGGTDKGRAREAFARSRSGV